MRYWAAFLLLSIAPAWAAAPRRIVSTSPGITEILFALGLGPRVAGVTNYCHYPPEVAGLAKVGTYLQPNLEAIAALAPDLVVIERNPVQLGEKLAALGLKSVEVNPANLEGIYAAIARIGEAADARASAGALAAGIRAQLEEVRAASAHRPRRRVAFIVGRTPSTLEGMVAAGRGSFLNELIEIAGGENVFHEAAAAYPKVSLEELLARNPDVIVDMGDMAGTANVTEQHKREVADLWRRYPVLTAVRQGRVFAVAADIYVVPGPRVGQAARELERMFR